MIGRSDVTRTIWDLQTSVVLSHSARFEGKKYVLLLSCAITHHSYVQSIVPEPCSRLIVKNNEAIDPFRWSVDGAASTGDVVSVCSAPQSQLSFVENPQRSMFAANLPTPVRSLFSRVQARQDRPTPCPLFEGRKSLFWQVYNIQDEIQ